MRKATLLAIMVLFAVGLASPLSAQSGLTYEVRGYEPTGEAVVADIALARPAGLAALVFGAAASIVALPFALMTCEPGKMYKKLVVEPYSYTFCRPLGEGM